MRKIFILFFCIGIFSIFHATNIYNIVDFGAKGDNKINNASYIQAAIDKCYADGGGRVYIPNGVFLSGTIVLKSNVELYLETQAVLKGSPAMKDYPSMHTKRGAFVYAYKQDNITICGKGTIDGNGEHSNFKSPDLYNGLADRPHPVAITRSSNVKLKEFKVRNGAFWNIMLEQCNQVSIDDVSVISRVIANNDGLDIVDCSNVKVSNCFFDVGDDAICFKSHSDIGVKRAVITNCIAKSESNAIKFGTMGIGGFEDVVISNCVLYDTRLSGITLQMVDGGTIDRVVISNIVMHNVNGSIFIKIGQRKGESPGILRNVTFSNITADGIGCWRADTTASYYKPEHDQRIGVCIVGMPDYEIENVTLDNIHLQFAGGGTEDDAKREIVNKAAVYPEYTNFGVTPAYGLNCRYIKGLNLSNIYFDYLEEDMRPAIYCSDISNVNIHTLNAKISASAQSILRLKNANRILISNCNAETATSFLTLEGHIKDVSLVGNDFSKVKQILQPSPPSIIKEIKGLDLNVR